ncbi:glycerol-3-phosphate dehydrogenase subunit GlpB [Necropsobacter massiliensis]|uniref:glycerol-3-phosphate dehydrogenase subunit GlpB n=1 Tax=Necropsobacter massiliensis TaxID=1400001 RepID=UPI000595896D|nr:glycerol-3-phosphate dehydrogenase subunit GlpB [Necropsobacter massiliensis]
MKFDVAIIGGGLAGLTCGIALQQQGKRCVIINNGQAAIDFSSGSLDLLGRLPDGEPVRAFEQSYEALARQLPQHPYCLLGKEKVLASARRFEALAQSVGLGLLGSSEQNHLRITPLGGLRATWLSSAGTPLLGDDERNFPHTEIAVLGIVGYHDFQPRLLADNLVQNPAFSHCNVTTAYLNIPELDQLRSEAREFRSVNISQLLEHELAFRDLVQEIKNAAAGAQAVFLPACFGIENQGFFNRLKQASGLNLYELPTLPPSLLGIRQHKSLRYHFEQAGGLMLNGDKALSAEFDGDRISRIYTRLHRQDALSAEHFVLASGSFFSNGLIADFEQIYEPVFNADIIGTATFAADARLSWTHHRFAAAQPYQSAGVAINADCRVRKCGRFLSNLYAAGNVIGGYNGLELGCASGVSVVTALVAAEHIVAAQQ